MAGVDVVVFDFGNVLIRWDPRYGFPNRTPAEIDRFFAEFDFHEFNHHQDAGRSVADGLAAIEATDPQWAPWLGEYLEGYPHTLLGPVPGTYDIVAELKRNGVRVYGLTNWWADLYHHAEAATPAIGLLDGVLVSGREGIAKPDPVIFERLARRYGFHPEQAVFIDDAPRNVIAAEGVGFHGIHFTDADALRQSLRALGLPLAAA